MKKGIVGVLMLVSVVAFARGGDGQGQSYNGQNNQVSDQNQVTQMNNNQKLRNPIYDNLTDEQKEKLEKVRKLRDGIREDGKKNHLNIVEKNIGIQKEMLEDKVDWTKVEKIQKEIEVLKTEEKMIRLKARKEIEEILGEDKFLMRRNNQKQGGNSKKRGNNQNNKDNGNRGNNGNGGNNGNRRNN